MVLISLGACSSWQKESPAVIRPPDYSAEFYQCVGEAVTRRLYTDCVEAALSDWLVWVEAGQHAYR